MYLVAIIFEQFLNSALPLFTGEGGKACLLATVLRKCYLAVLSLTESRFQHGAVAAVPGAVFSPHVQTLILQVPTGF